MMSRCMSKLSAAEMEPSLTTDCNASVNTAPSSGESTANGGTLNEMKEEIRALYGENKRLTDDDYDKTLAVKCVNDVFVGQKADGIIAY